MNDWEQYTATTNWLISAADVAIFGLKDDEFLIDTLEYAIKSLEPQINSSISMAKTRTLLNSADANSFINFLNPSDLTKPVISRLYRFHQLAKFGPSEQLLLRSQLLDDLDNSELNALITARELLVERLYFSNESRSVTHVEFEKLEVLNKKLAAFTYPKPKWDQQLNTIGSITKSIDASELFIDYRHNSVTNKIEVFLISKSKVEVEVINDAALIRQNVKSFKDKILSSDPTYFQEGEELYSRLIKPYITDQHERVLIAPSSFLFDLPFSSLIVSVGSELKENGNSSFNQTSRGLKLPKAAQQIRFDLLHLGEVYDLEVVTSVRAKVRQKTEQAYTFVGVGAPAFSGDKDASAVAFNDLSSMARNNKVYCLILNLCLVPRPNWRRWLQANYSKRQPF